MKNGFHLLKTILHPDRDYGKNNSTDMLRVGKNAKTGYGLPLEKLWDFFRKSALELMPGFLGEIIIS